MSLPRCSVVIPSYNRSGSLSRVLEALSRQSLPVSSFEVIPVLDGSTDDSVQMLEGWRQSGKLPRLRWHRQENAGQASARNAGVMLAAAPIVLFLDDDIIPEPDLVENHLRWYSDDESIAIMGNAPIEHKSDLSLYGRVVWSWWADTYYTRGLSGRIAGYRDFCAGNVSLRRLDFLAAGGFDASFRGYGGEDFDLGYRLQKGGVRFITDAQAKATHHHLSRAGDVLRNMRQEGRHDVLLGRKHPELRRGLRLMTRAMGAEFIFKHPRLTEVSLWWLRGVLRFYEWIGMKKSWRNLFGKLRHVSYWLGVRSVLGAWQALNGYWNEAPPLPESAIDITHGLPKALPQLWVNGPSRIRVTGFGKGIGAIEIADPIDGPVHARLLDEMVWQLEPQLWVALTESGLDPWELAFPAASVSIVIPAHNAEATIAETLASVQAQTFSSWEAFVVDDGSKDATCRIVEAIAAKDARIRLLKQAQSGAARARNAALAQVRAPWVLCLDADDWIASNYLERMLGSLKAHPEWDAVHCGWVYVFEDGTTLPGGSRQYYSQDMFLDLARSCPFIIHACVMRRSLIQAAGGFEPLITCDWDLWQRVARTGAVFGFINEPLAFYRIRAGSESSSTGRMLQDGLAVIKRGHQADPRVANPAQRHAAGAVVSDGASAQWYYAAEIAARKVALGRDPMPALDAVDTDEPVCLDPAGLANSLFQSALVQLSQNVHIWFKLYSQLLPGISVIWQTLESRTRTPLLAQCTRVMLERKVVQAAGILPVTAGTTTALGLEIAEPLKDITFKPTVERASFFVTAQGKRIGWLDLPVLGGVVAANTLAKAVAQQYSWPILGHFFAGNLYSRLRMQTGDGSTAVYRDETLLGGVTGEAAASDFAGVLHDTLGWTVFLQELFGIDDATDAWFYGTEPQKQAQEGITSADGRIRVELSSPVPNVSTLVDSLRVEVMLGAEAVGVVEVAVHSGQVSSGALRALILSKLGLAILRVGVQRGVVGRRWHPQEGSLLENLRQAAKQGGSGFDGSTAVHLQSVATHKPEKIFGRMVAPIQGGPYSSKLPILMYHRFTATGAPHTRSYRVAPAAFEQQLAYLKEEGYASVTLKQWGEAMRLRRPLPMKAVAITVDDGYDDFLLEAWPLLKQYGFTATVFLVADAVGSSNAWDSTLGEKIRLMNWDEVAWLNSQGVAFGSHTLSHRPLLGLSPDEMMRELSRSRQLIEEHLGVSVDTITYPYGWTDRIVEHMAGVCGYAYGLTIVNRKATLRDMPLALPRLSVTDFDTLNEFAEKVALSEELINKPSL